MNNYYTRLKSIIYTSQLDISTTIFSQVDGQITNLGSHGTYFIDFIDTTIFNESEINIF